MKFFKDLLFENQDLNYQKFQSKLMPTVPQEKVIGVRMPIIQNIICKYKNSTEAQKFIQILPHKFYEEDLLHGGFIGEEMDFEKLVLKLDKFLPYVDNWAVCDTLKIKLLKKNKCKKEFLVWIEKWLMSSDVYVVRFAIKMLMDFYLDEDFSPDFLERVAAIKTDEYYLKMMIAWYFATALAKRYSYAISYLENRKLTTWVHQKTIQKAVESFRITPKQKEYLKSLRKKNRK